MSYDLDNIKGIAAPDYISLLNQLTDGRDTGPIVLRVGASKSDRLKTVWDTDVIEAMKTVNQKTGAAPSWGSL
jgi:hypothetical protein